jgi:N-acetylmuramoyl-L-alanine amidase
MLNVVSIQQRIIKVRGNTIENVSHYFIDEGCPNIISRAGWKARNATNRIWLNTPVPFIVIHDTVSPTCRTHDACIRRIQGIQNHHMNEKSKKKMFDCEISLCNLFTDWDDIAYNFLIGENGLVYEGRGWTYVGAHRSGYNNRSIGK